jgi:hypothetical protein
VTGGFRPWCPFCEVTSEPASRECDRCGFRLYPTNKELRRIRDDRRQATAARVAA